MKSKMLFVISLVSLVYISGCDRMFLSQIKVSPALSKTSDVNISDQKLTVHILEHFAQSKEYPFFNQGDPECPKGTLFYIKGTTWSGPLISLEQEESNLVITVCQFAGMAEFPDYKQAKKELFKSCIETFGSDRVMLNENTTEIMRSDTANRMNDPARFSDPPIPLNTSDKTRRLRLSDIKFDATLTKKQVFAIWGPPDAVAGFGLEYQVYELEDGRKVWLLFAQQEPRPLIKAIAYVNNKDAKAEIIFDGWEEAANKGFGP
jgi:hypothetical protein